MIDVQMAMKFDRDLFEAEILTLSDADAVILAKTFPRFFGKCFSLPGEVFEPEARPEPPPPPKKPALSPEEFDVVRRRVVLHVKQNPDRRAEEIAKALDVDGKVVLRALKGFVSDGTMYVDGERKAARFKVAAPKVDAEAAE